MAPNPSSQGDSAGEQASNSAGSEAETAAGAVVETKECPNCGRIFAGNYCPSCGQEADSSISFLDVVSGFFREPVDLESGVGPTFVGLTLAPGKTLRRYLEGERKQFATPGRYLLGAAVVSALLTGPPLRLVHPFWNGLVWRAEYYVSVGVGKGTAMTKLYEGVLEAVSSQVFLVVTILISTSLLAHLLQRLFNRQMGRFPEALAASAFLIGHVSVLEKGALLLAISTVGSVVIQFSPMLRGLFGALVSTVVVLGYVGWWGDELGPGWRGAVGGAFAAGWAQAEATLLGAAALGGYFLWQLDLFRAGGTLQ